MWLVILIPIAIFSVIAYQNQKKALLAGVDQKLYASAVMLKASLPSDYHDTIDKNSFTQSEYDNNIVDKNNKLCLELDLQYLWSCLIVGEDIVFTTSTSPGKDVTKKDHAGFFEVHRDPHAFGKVFSTMKPDYSSFHNEWGHGRMILVPYVDKNGRPYCFGASKSTNDIYMILRKTAINYFIIFLITLLIGLSISSSLSNSFSKPIVEISKIADDIAKGNLFQKVEVKGSAEVRLLSESISAMSNSIGEKIAELNQDIAQRKKVEEQLRESEHEKALVLDNASEIIAFHDRDHKIKWANKAYLKATGLTLGEIKGKKCYVVWGLDRVCVGCPVIEAIKAEGVRRVELTPQNQPHWPDDQGSWMVSAAPVEDNEGNIIGAIEVAYDITEQRKLEVEREKIIGQLEQKTKELEKTRDEIANKAQELESANEELEVSNEELQTRGEELESTNEELQVANEELEETTKELEKTRLKLEEFASNLEKKVEKRTKELKEVHERLIRSEKLATLGKVTGSLSHELRNPLGVMKNAIYYLVRSKKRYDKEIQERYFHIIKEQVETADKIIANALDFVRPRKIHLEKIEIGKIIDSTFSEIEVPKNIDIQKDYKGKITVVVDSLQISQAIKNIALNSIQAIGGKKGRIRIHSEKENNFAKIIFEDNGIGIKKDELIKIFEPLYSTKARGIGLGLSVIKDIIEKHDGKVSVESEFNEGTKVIISLPLA